MAVLEFWYEFGSTYTYLTVGRIRRAALEAGVELAWRPFLLYPLLLKQGMTQGPFLPYPRKLGYMWRDIERRAEEHGLPYRKPAQYPPADVLTSARIAWLGGTEGWAATFTEAAFKLHWTEGRAIGSEDNLKAAVLASGQDPAAVLERVRSSEVKEGLKAQTEEAERRGVFGSPTFLVGKELFWGDDRLEQALRWAQAH